MQSCRKTLLALTVAWFAMLTPELSSAQAQTLAPQPLTELERLSFESTPVLPEPDYLSGQRRWQDFGVYFGIGVRRLELSLKDNPRVTNDDLLGNGAAFNVGLWDGDWSYEYIRDVDLVASDRTLTMGGKSSTRLAIERHAFWGNWLLRKQRGFYLHVGGGLQLAQIELGATSPKVFSDTSLALGAGIAYFATPRFLLLFRTAASRNFDSLAGGKGGHLRATFTHTLFLNYAFPL